MTLLQEWKYLGGGHEGFPHKPTVFTSSTCHPETDITGKDLKVESYTEEDSGYHSSGTPEDLSSVETGREVAADFPSDDEDIVDIAGEEKTTDEGRDAQESIHNPLTSSSVHSRLFCCTNGHFNVTSATFSNFESNCGCTTRNLVDWSTRVSWSNLSLRHQVKMREVTALSPYRTPATPWGLPCPPFRLCQAPPIKHITPSSPAASSELPCRISPQRRVKQEQCGDEQDAAEGERTYRCEEVGCGRIFCRNEELTRHLRIHSGQRPFTCQKCGRRFVRRDHLTKHQRTHLPAHVKRSYSCPLPACTHRYTRSDALTRHMWTAHHIRARQPARVARPHPTTTTTTTTTTSNTIKMEL